MFEALHLRNDGKEYFRKLSDSGLCLIGYLAYFSELQ